jgi:GntR family transcriptional regulator, negative regulator for fad regulon and positive regulator of fabA
MQDWLPPLRPLAHAEQVLLTAIIEGKYPPGSSLPAERELSVRLGVTRPTLREVLRRLESDGWLVIQQGKATRVKDYWKEGGLNVLNSLVRLSRELPEDFINNLLEVRLAMAPAYTGAAVQNQPEQVAACLEGSAALSDTAEGYAAFDWTLHSALALLSGNPIYSLILNGFAGFYEQMAVLYFSTSQARAASLDYYHGLNTAAERKDAALAERLTRLMMKESISLWNERDAAIAIEQSKAAL